MYKIYFITKNVNVFYTRISSINREYGSKNIFFLKFLKNVDVYSKNREKLECYCLALFQLKIIFEIHSKICNLI